MNRNWYAVYTKPQCEKKVAALLTKKKIENLCPLNRIKHASGNRRKMSYEPLFPTFVFVYIAENEMHEVRKTSDVINFVYWLGKPAVIKAAEVENAAHFTSLYYNIRLEKTAVIAGGMIRITNEPSFNLSKGIVSANTRQIRLALPSIGFAMIAQTERTSDDIFQIDLEASSMLS